MTTYSVSHANFKNLLCVNIQEGLQCIIMSNYSEAADENFWRKHTIEQLIMVTRLIIQPYNFTGLDSSVPAL